MSPDGHFYVKGRSKNMLLGPNGQNIYPEEIEDKLNSMAMVSESILLQKDDKLVALVHPDMEEATHWDSLKKTSTTSWSRTARNSTP